LPGSNGLLRSLKLLANSLIRINLKKVERNISATLILSTICLNQQMDLRLERPFLWETHRMQTLAMACMVLLILTEVTMITSPRPISLSDQKAQLVVLDVRSAALVLLVKLGVLFRNSLVLQHLSTLRHRKEVFSTHLMHPQPSASKEERDLMKVWTANLFVA